MALRLDDLLFYVIKNTSRMDFARLIVTGRYLRKNEKPPGYTFEQYSHSATDMLLCNKTNKVRLVQLQNVNGGISHCVSVVDKWIFDSNFSHALPLSLESLHLCCTDENSQLLIQGFKTVITMIEFTPTKKNPVKFRDLMN